MTEREQRKSEYGRDERRVPDPAGRPEPYVEGPTGPAPIASELRGDPGEQGDRTAEGGAMAGAIAGTSVAGPVGGVVGALAGGAIGKAADTPRREAEDDGASDGDHRPRTAQDDRVPPPYSVPGSTLDTTTQREGKGR